MRNPRLTGYAIWRSTFFHHARILFTIIANRPQKGVQHDCLAVLAAASYDSGRRPSCTSAGSSVESRRELALGALLSLEAGEAKLRRFRHSMQVVDIDIVI